MSRSAILHLAALIRDKQTPENLRFEAVRSLATYSQNRSAYLALISLAENKQENESLRREAIRALSAQPTDE